MFHNCVNVIIDYNTSLYICWYYSVIYYTSRLIISFDVLACITIAIVQIHEGNFNYKACDMIILRNYVMHVLERHECKLER